MVKLHFFGKNFFSIFSVFGRYNLRVFFIKKIGGNNISQIFWHIVPYLKEVYAKGFFTQTLRAWRQQLLFLRKRC